MGLTCRGIVKLIEMLGLVPLYVATDRTAERILHICFETCLSAQQFKFVNVLECAVCKLMRMVEFLFGLLVQVL